MENEQNLTEQPGVEQVEQVEQAEQTIQPGVTYDEDSPNKGRVILENGTELLFTRTESSTLYVKDLELLDRTLAIDNPLPTQIIYPNQDEGDLKLAADYIDGVRKIIAKIKKYGMSSSIESYSFRLPHFGKLMEWQNIVVRLQFAKELNAILRTLNENLDSSVENKWGVLGINEAGEYNINGQVLKFGDKVDVFTTKEKVMSDMIFNSHEVLNCAVIDGETSPIFHHPTEDLNNVSFEDLEKRSAAAVGEKEHLLGTDAFSFIHGLLWRIVGDNEEDNATVEVTTNLLTQTDRDPQLSSRQHDKDMEELGELELPFGINEIEMVAYQNYYSKRASRAAGFMETMRYVSENQKAFRRRFKKATKDVPEMIINIYDILRFLAGGRSRLLKITGVTKEGSLIDLVTIDRNMVIERFRSFNRFNTQPVQFFEIEHVKPKGKKKDIDPDHFRSTGNQISANDLVGFIHSSAKIYYWGDDEQPSKDAPIDSKNIVAMYLDIKKAFAFSERDEP